MQEYKQIKVVNKSLSEDDFLAVYELLCKLEGCLLSDKKDTILFSEKSDKKKVFSVDFGGYVSELDAFRGAIRFYLGAYASGVEITTISTTEREQLLHRESEARER